MSRLSLILQPGDVVVVPRIDRLARNLSEGLRTIEELHAQRIYIRSLAEGLDTGDDSPQFTEDESQEIEAAKSTVRLERRFNPPRFKVGPDLDAKVIEMSITINDKQEKFEFIQQEFFETLTATCGNETAFTASSRSSSSRPSGAFRGQQCVGFLAIFSCQCNRPLSLTLLLELQ